MKEITPQRGPPMMGLDPLVAAAAAQAAIAWASAWQDVEALREERKRRQQEINLELEPIRLQIAAAEKALESQVRVEEIRSRMLRNALSVAGAAPEVETRKAALVIAYEILQRKLPTHANDRGKA